MNIIFAKLLTRFIKDKTERYHKIQDLRRGIVNYRKIKLIMTLVVKNEEDILEKNIRFHQAMGVDGFIVTNHNSTDSTPEILHRLMNEGLVLHVFNESTVKHMREVWVTRMIHLAKHKYKADWIINADADEFYYSNSLNLKKSICSVPRANVLWVDSRMLFPDNRKDFLHCPYFVMRGFREFEAKKFNLDMHDNYTRYKYPIGDKLCHKVIHKTKGFISITAGNHSVEMKNIVQIQSADIRLYHYHCKNYDGYAAKAKRWKASADLCHPQGGTYHHRYIEALANDTLQELYEDIYGEKQRNFLMSEGIVAIDKSISNFLNYKNII